LEWPLLSLSLERWDPLEEVLVPDVSSKASLFDTLEAELSSEPELSVEVALLLKGL
jgi:hypothetical protein